MNDSNGQQSDLAVMDANEFKQKRRLKRILDLHESVEERANKLFQLEIEGEITRDARNIGLMKTVQQFIRECWTLLDEHMEACVHGNGDDDIACDEEYCKYFSQTLGTIDFETGREVKFVGLDQFLRAQEVYIEEWEQEKQTRHGPSQTEVVSQRRTVPESLSWRAYLLLRLFLSREKGIEIQFEELDDSLPTWGFEEVPDEEGTEVAAEKRRNGDSTEA